MSFEQLEQTPSTGVENFFKENRELLKERTRQALQAGEFKEDSISFVKQVVGKIPEEEVSDYRKETKKLINEVKKEERQKGERQQEKWESRAKDAEELARQEEERTGIHPEDLKEQ